MLFNFAGVNIKPILYINIFFYYYFAYLLWVLQTKGCRFNVRTIINYIFHVRLHISRCVCICVCGWVRTLEETYEEQKTRELKLLCNLCSAKTSRLNRLIFIQFVHHTTSTLISSLCCWKHNIHNNNTNNNTRGKKKWSSLKLQ